MKHQTRVLLTTTLALALLATALGGAPQTKTVMLHPAGQSHVQGSAVLTQEGQDLVITIDVKGLPPGATPHQAHIHDGTCEHLGHKTPYDFNPVVNGHSTTTLKGVNMSVFAKGSYSIVIHNLVANVSEHVACGGPI